MPTTPPEQTNDRPDREDNGGTGQGELNPDQTEPGRPRIRPVPGDDRDEGSSRGSDDGISGPGDGEIIPDQTEPGRPRIRPVPGDDRG